MKSALDGDDEERAEPGLSVGNLEADVGQKTRRLGGAVEVTVAIVRPDAKREVDDLAHEWEEARVEDEPASGTQHAPNLSDRVPRPEEVMSDAPSRCTSIRPLRGIRP